jgi:hypothetical protein
MISMLQRLKQIINNETISGWFAILAVATIPLYWAVSVILMGLALIHWMNPQRKNKIIFD